MQVEVESRTPKKVSLILTAKTAKYKGHISARVSLAEMTVSVA
jgi:hypothetical protein